MSNEQTPVTPIEYRPNTQLINLISTLFPVKPMIVETADRKSSHRAIEFIGFSSERSRIRFAHPLLTKQIVPPFQEAEETFDPKIIIVPAWGNAQFYVEKEEKPQSISEIADFLKYQMGMVTDPQYEKEAESDNDNLGRLVLNYPYYNGGILLDTNDIADMVRDQIAMTKKTGRPVPDFVFRMLTFSYSNGRNFNSSLLKSNNEPE